MFDSGIQNQQTRDQLATNPSTLENSKFLFETIICEEGPTITETTGIGDSWIVGSDTNGIVGTNLGTAAGTQQVVGGTNTTTVSAIINPNKIFHEHFNFTKFKGTPFTSNWDTTYPCKLRMNNLSSHAMAYNTVATFGSIAKNDGTITRAKITVTETKWGNDVIKYYLRTMPTNAWEEFIPNNIRTFNISGNDMSLRILFIGNGAKETYIEDLNVDYG